MSTSTPFIAWAHASALMNLRAKSLEAYGIDPKSLMVIESHSLIEWKGEKTRALAKIGKNSRALAIETEHAMIAL